MKPPGSGRSGGDRPRGPNQRPDQRGRPPSREDGANRPPRRGAKPAGGWPARDPATATRGGERAYDRPDRPSGGQGEQGVQGARDARIAPRDFGGQRVSGGARSHGSEGGQRNAAHQGGPSHGDRAEQGPRPPRPEFRGPRRDSGGDRRDAEAAVPKGTLWLYGIHAVAAALANPSRRLRRLMLTEEAEAALAQRRPPPWPLQPERTDRDRIDRLLGRDAVHQGAALLADMLPTPGLQQVLERPGPLLVLDQVTDTRNIGAILRSAAAFGVAAVVTQDRNAPEETGAMAKAASGALETVPLLRAVNIARTLIALKAAGLWIVGLDAGAPALAGPALAERRVALVLGAEGEGLRRLTRDTCDEVTAIAMPGGTESLNVSAAAAVALYELTRRIP